MSIEGQGHFFTIYFPGFVCFVLYKPKISGEHLQEHWSSGLKIEKKYKRFFSISFLYFPPTHASTVLKFSFCLFYCSQVNSIKNQRTNGPVKAHLSLGLVKDKTYKTWKIYDKKMTLTFSAHIPS